MLEGVAPLLEHGLSMAAVPGYATSPTDLVHRRSYQCGVATQLQTEIPMDEYNAYFQQAIVDPRPILNSDLSIETHWP